MQSLYLGSGQFYFSFLRSEYLHKSYGILHETIIFSPAFTYLSNYVNMDSNMGFFSKSLLFGPTRCFWIVLHISVLRPKISHSSRGSLVHFIGEWSQKSVLSAYMYLLLQKCHCFYTFSDNRRIKYVYIYCSRYIYISVKTLYLIICIYIYLNMNSY